MDTLVRLKGLLQNIIATQAGPSPYYTVIDGLILLEARTERHPTCILHRPSLCLVVQGAKWTTFGNVRLDYVAGQAMVVGVEMPGFSQVVEGSDGAPYYSVVVELDLATLREVYEAMRVPPKADFKPVLGAFVMDLAPPILSCIADMVELLQDIDAVPILYPALMRELCFLLLRSPYANAITGLMVATRFISGVLNAIQYIREHYREKLSLEQLGGVAGLSSSAFHRKFKNLTSISALQYQKHLRLLEARRLMITKEMPAEAAAFEVGYGSPSHFNRDYARQFGAPPRRNISSLSLT